MKYFFFGVGPNDRAGHYLHDENLNKIWSSRSENQLPFKYTILDGGLMPEAMSCGPQGKIHRSEINGYTIISMPDRSMDHRPACNANFIVEGIFNELEMVEICSAKFPKLWSRIKPFMAEISK